MSAPVHGSCHCGAVQFDVRLQGGLAGASRCNCSICSMRGAVTVTARREDITFLKGQDKLTLYQFGTKTAEHFFCSICGIYTHHRRRSNPDEIGVNLACLDGQTPFLPEVPVGDGQHHSKDTGHDRIAGWLRYMPAEDEA